MAAVNEQRKYPSREEFLAPVIRQQEIITHLEAEVAALKTELEKFRRPSPTSRNSSQPPSRDRKANSAPPRKKRKQKRRGQVRQARRLMDKPDHIIPAPVTGCRACQANLTKLQPEKDIQRQITEIPPLKPFIVETQQHQVTCPHCHHLNRGRLPIGFEIHKGDTI